ncbi:PREDICTED: thioredoxin domain-containing protein 15 [Nicrophorus vespilloides]|uniref:Thioredoxin domain-containing protein 15 n=1 Tax=Nicrophorus vespilloides TaxID=110193 RepID=A0ABM1NGK2_NICVS|nr:PREDICTED: thioredoxin domain-containing protein 15 [Nicrophorus vespilloides]
MSRGNVTIKPVAETMTLTNITEQEPNVTQKFVSCLENGGSPEVQLVNDTEVMKMLVPDTNITSKEQPGKCILVLFYSKYCPFSSLAAPPFNALSRVFPDIKMVAINAMLYHLFNTQNGIVGLPSLLLFHNGKIVAKYNETDYKLELFSKFITKATGIKAEEKVFVKSEDFRGPVHSLPFRWFDPLMLLSWTFIIICAFYYFTKTKFWKWIIETVKRNWRESEAQAQHEHVE